MKPTATSLALGARIRHARACRGFSRRAVAGYCGITEKTLTAWETGKAIPSERHYEPLSCALAIPENLLRAGGEGWERIASRLPRLQAPGLLMDTPVQFVDRRDASADEVDVFRQKPELQPEEPAKAIPSVPEALPRVDDPSAAWWREHFRALDIALAPPGDDD